MGNIYYRPRAEKAHVMGNEEGRMIGDTIQIEGDLVGLDPPGFRLLPSGFILCPANYEIAADMSSLVGARVRGRGSVARERDGKAIAVEVHQLEGMERESPQAMRNHRDELEPWGRWHASKSPESVSPVTSRPFPVAPADVAKQIMRAIEAEQAIHKDTLIRIITQALGNDR